MREKIFMRRLQKSTMDTMVRGVPYTVSPLMEREGWHD